MHQRNILFSFFFLLLFFTNSVRGADTPNLNLKDLGFDQQSFKPNQEQAILLETRTQKLQRHQLMGYTTAALVLATVFAAPENASRASTTHIGLAAAAVSSYAYTAFLSLSAPEVDGFEKSGYGTKIHKAMVWIHLPAMVLLPFAGAEAQKARINGEKPTGIGKLHHTLGSLAFASILTSAVSMTIEF